MITPLASWNRLPVVMRATLAGLSAAVVGTAPCATLLGINLRVGRAFPWAAPLVAVYLWLFWRYLRGAGPPRHTADARRERLRARKLSRRLWGRSLLAAGLAFAAIIAATVAAAYRLGTRAPALPSLTGIPILTLIVLQIASAAAAGVVEEASFRGIMQTPIERRHGPAAAWALVALAFMAIHLSHGFRPLYMAADGAASMALSIVVTLTGSILPGIVVHAASDIAVPLWLLARGSHPSAMGADGSGAQIYVWGAAALCLGAAAVWAFLNLSRAAREEDAALAAAAPR